MTILMFLMMITNTIFIFLNHPLSMGMTLIMQTLMIALFSGMMLSSFWYSYILVLIFLGGLLILFIYVSTMAANEQIGSIPIPMIIFTIVVIFMMMTLSIDFIPSNMFIFSDSNIFKENYAWMFTSPMISLASFLMLYLFIVLLAIVKITKFWGGSIRPVS